ncbi:TolC family outer membrane protein [Acuticoccus mangrovi]|uniref:TolC family outer membrane protein n=1 Tax=Acuticoccus mangrovi TaxID=2796142 RepID=A0A934IP04_9HYPH|nr:TolC family outer membrane protein [Acuticoccus mangrovi]MBJ3777392.1 TolC family outer membrane protein [Acuticoccus mangrovi]
MRGIILCLVAGLLGACARQGAVPATYGNAPTNAVDLASADGLFFLQSPQTGFLEAAPNMQVTAFSPSPETRRIRRPQRAAAPEIGDGRVVVSSQRGDVVVRQEPMPEITVRPMPAAPAAPVARIARPPAPAAPEAGSITDAFGAAYDTSPAINRVRADLRAADEEIAVAKAGNRPTVTASVSGGLAHTREFNTPTGYGTSATLSEEQTPATLSLNISQPLFRGFRTRNATLQAEANVRAERERLRATEQDVLLQTALAYLDVRRYRAGVALRRKDLAFLEEQVSAASARQRFGEGTRTDIDQAESRLAEARASLASEEASLGNAEARFMEVTGLSPGAAASDIDVASLVPPSLGEALRRGEAASPDISRALHEADEAGYQVKALQGEALPSVSLNGRLQTDIDSSDSDRDEAAELRLRVDIPIYQGGRVSAQVRRAKELHGGARIAVDLARNSVRADLASAWSTYTASLIAIRAADASVASARRAVSGVLEELSVGQRTTLDVLDTQRDLVAAEITRLTARRQRDGAAFEILRAMGELDIGLLGLNVRPYNPQEHYAASKDRWAGMRTPDGR